MTAFDIYSAVGDVGEDILEESEIVPKQRITKIIPLMAAAACFAVFAAGLSHALRSDNIEQHVTDISDMTTGSYVPETAPAIEFEVTAADDGDVTSNIQTNIGHQITGDGVVIYDTNAQTTSVSLFNTETVEMFTEPYPDDTEEAIDDEESKKMPDPFGNKAEGTGGDENDGFYLPGNHILNNIPGSLLDLRDSNEVNKWLEKDKLSSRSEAPSSIKDYVNLYSFIIEFNITREEAETALEYYLNTPEEFEHITYEHLDIIFSGDVELITKTFASDLSIVVGDRIYTPEWLYTHSIEEYRAAGITAEDILSRVDSYRYILFTDEARQAFSEKLSAYTGERVVIGTVTYENKDEVYDIQDDVMEDAAEDVYDEVVEVPEVYE